VVLARGLMFCGSRRDGTNERQSGLLAAALECTKVLTGFYLGAHGARVYSSRPDRRLPIVAR
jgi:hypothetical protein